MLLPMFLKTKNDMINANEIRIGNWYLHDEYWSYRNDNNQSLYFMWVDRDWYALGECTLQLNQVSPIPLTNEILEKCGFEKSQSNDIYERTIFSIQVANNTSLYFDAHKDHMRDYNYVEWYLSHEWNNNHYKNDFWNTPKYLHQLQNLIYCLTKKEINYTP